MNSIFEVVTANENTLLTSVERVKQELGITGADDDDLLKAKIREATSDIELRTRTFRKEAVQETFWPETKRRRVCAEALVLRRFPMVSIASVTIDDEVVDSAEYRFSADSGLLYRMDASGYPIDWEFSKAAVIAYTGGYTMPGEASYNLPPSLESAAIELVSAFWLSRGRDPMVKAEENPGVSRFEYWVGAIGPTGDLPPSVMTKIQPFRPLVFA